MYRSRSGSPTDRLDAPWSWLRCDGGHLDFPTTSFGEVDKQAFSRYGFDGPEDGDAGAFFESLASEIEGWDIDDLSFAE